MLYVEKHFGQFSVKNIEFGWLIYIKIIRDGIRIGECKSQDKWLSCTGGCNDLGTGYGWRWGCAVEIKCLESRLLINSINNN